MTPTARTLQWLKRAGYTAGVVERYNQYTRRRHDLFGFIDLVAVCDGSTVGVQACSMTDLAKRVSKVLACEHAPTWLSGGNRIWVIGWAKRGAQGKRKLWTPTVREVVADLNQGGPGWYELDEADLSPVPRRS